MVKYRKWENSFSLNLYTYVAWKKWIQWQQHRNSRNREEKCTTNYFSHKYLSQKCFVSINLSGISINCLQNVFCLSNVEKGTNGGLVTTSTWATFFKGWKTPLALMQNKNKKHLFQLPHNVFSIEYITYSYHEKKERYK